MRAGHAIDRGFPSLNRHRDSRRGAFTLFEVILVLVLILIVLAAAWPSLDSWFQAQRIQEGAEDLQTNLIKARTLSMEEGRRYGITVGDDNQSYVLVPLDTDIMPSDLPGKRETYQLPKGITFDSTDWMVEFQPDGTAKFDQYGTEPMLTIPLREQGGNRFLYVQVRGLTGAAKITNQPAAAVQPTGMQP